MVQTSYIYNIAVLHTHTQCTSEHVDTFALCLILFLCTYLPSSTYMSIMLSHWYSGSYFRKMHAFAAANLDQTKTFNQLTCEMIYLIFGLWNCWKYWFCTKSSKYTQLKLCNCTVGHRVYEQKFHLDKYQLLQLLSSLLLLVHYCKSCCWMYEYWMYFLFAQRYKIK